MEIVNMNKKYIDKYAELFMQVFNGEPWNDKWTEETAEKRILNIMNTDTFVGFSMVESGRVVGIICGQEEQFYDGLHFQIQEFCIRKEKQKNGYGTMLLNYLNDYLKKENVINVYLLTSRGERTEGYYRKRNFITSAEMIVMSKNENGAR